MSSRRAPALLTARRARRLALQFGRFGVVGTLATAVNLAVVILCVESQLLGPLPANVVGYGIGFTVSYLGCLRWVFRSTAASGATLIKFAAVAGLGLTLNQLVNGFIIYVLGQHYLIGLAVFVATVPLVTFLLHRTWVFRGRAPAPNRRPMGSVLRSAGERSSRAAIALLALLGSASPPLLG